MTGHFRGLRQIHGLEQRRSHIGKSAILHFCVLIVADEDERHRIQRMGRVGRAVGIEGVVGIAVVGYDDGGVIVLLGCLNNFFHAIVEHLHSLLYGCVNARMTHHIAVGEIDHDEVILL